MTIKEVDTIVHAFILGQFLHNAAYCRIILDERYKKFHLCELGHLLLFHGAVC